MQDVQCFFLPQGLCTCSLCLKHFPAPPLFAWIAPTCISLAKSSLHPQIRSHFSIKCPHHALDLSFELFVTVIILYLFLQIEQAVSRKGAYFHDILSPAPAGACCTGDDYFVAEDWMNKSSIHSFMSNKNKVVNGFRKKQKQKSLASPL